MTMQSLILRAEERVSIRVRLGLWLWPQGDAVSVAVSGFMLKSCSPSSNIRGLGDDTVSFCVSDPISLVSTR